MHIFYRAHTPPSSTPTQVVFGLIMGRAADVYSRKAIIFYGMVISNIAILYLGLSNNYVQLLLSRVLLGAGQSCFATASFSIIADYFPAEFLAQVSARQVLEGFPLFYASNMYWPGRAGGGGGSCVQIQSIRPFSEPAPSVDSRTTFFVTCE